MKTYVEKNFDKDYIKTINIQEIGIYYNVPIKNIYEDKREEFDYDDLENDKVLLDKISIDSGIYVEDFDEVNYDYTDELDRDEFLECLMNYKKYKHYLVVLFNATWLNSSGYKIFDKYKECFYRDYDTSMYVVGSSISGKYLKLREYHHDKPTGHTSIIIGLSDLEYEKISNKEIQEIIDFGASCLTKIVDFK